MRERQRAGGCGQQITAGVPGGKRCSSGPGCGVGGFHYKIKEICDLWYNDLRKQKRVEKPRTKDAGTVLFEKK